MSAAEHLNKVQFNDDIVIQHDPLKYRTVTATHQKSGQMVGYLKWFSDKTQDGMGNKISGVRVSPGYRRQGLATAMLEHARQHNPAIDHHTARTPDGRAWAASRP